MLKKHYTYFVIALLISLFIYSFYRTEKTLINQIFILTFSLSKYLYLKHYIQNHIFLNEMIVYSFPEGLWVFCATIVSRCLYVKIGNREISCIFIPLIFSLGLEILQLLHWVNGMFDIQDVIFIFILWFMSFYFMKNKGIKQNIFNPINIKSIECFCMYAIVYFAHVLK